MKKSTALQLDRDQPVPLYEQVKALLIAELQASNPDERHGLSDAALMERFGVSRMTVRSAVSDLVRAGIVKRVPGRGTFLIRAAPMEIDLDGLDRFFQEWHLPGLDPGTKLLAFRHVKPPPEIAARLQIARGSTVLMLRRLRTTAGVPATLDVRYVVDWCAKNIERADAERDMLFDIIAKRAGVPTTAVEQEVGAQVADAATAKALGVAEGSPLLSREATFFTTGDRPIITGNGLYRSDRFRFRMRAER